MPQIMQNGHLRVECDDKGNARVTQIGSGLVWEPDSEGVPGVIHIPGHANEIVIRQTDTAFIITYCSFPSDASIRCVTSIALDGSRLIFTVRELALPGRFDWIDYPYRAFPILTDTPDGFLVLPYMSGCLVPTGKRVLLGVTDYWQFHDTAHSPRAQGWFMPTLPFYAAYRQRKGFTAVLQDGEDACLAYLANSDEVERFIPLGQRSPHQPRTCAWPRWLSCLGQLTYARVVTYTFAEDMDYQTAALHYRAQARQEGLLTSLVEKARERPQTLDIQGAPLVAYYAGYPHVAPPHESFPYRYADVQQAVVNLRAAGVEKAFLHFWGGFKTQPPGAMPFDDLPGSVAELARTVAATHDAGYVFTFYNDISAMLEEGALWDKHLFRREHDGTCSYPRWQRTCPALYQDLAEAIFPKLIAATGVKASYIDCINGLGLLECYDAAHPLDRRQDRDARIRLYRYLHSQGLIFGGEFIAWWSVPGIEYSNGVGMCSLSDPILRQHPIPLFNLVFHDCVIPYCNAADDYTVANGSELRDKILRDVLYGVPAMFYVNLRDAGAWHQTIVDTNRVMYPVLRHTAFAPMTRHWMSDDQLYQETEFGDHRVAVNFAHTPRNGLPGKSYHAVCAGQTLTASLAVTMELTSTASAKTR